MYTTNILIYSLLRHNVPVTEIYRRYPPSHRYPRGRCLPLYSLQSSIERSYIEYGSVCKTHRPTSHTQCLSQIPCTLGSYASIMNHTQQTQHTQHIAHGIQRPACHPSTNRRIIMHYRPYRHPASQRIAFLFPRGASRAGFSCQAGQGQDNARCSRQGRVKPKQSKKQINNI